MAKPPALNNASPPAPTPPAGPTGNGAPAPSADFGGGSFGAAPTMNTTMTFKEVGTSGLRAFSGYVREDFLPQLQGRQAAVVYREMADNSAVIGGLLLSITASMQKVEWRVEAADDTPAAQEAADFADGLRDDMSEPWEGVVNEGLSMLTYGYAPMEIVYKKRQGTQNLPPDPGKPGRTAPRSKYDDGKIGWRKLPLRGQDTVLKWFFDETGDVLGLTQQPYIGPIRDIPMEKLLLFRPSAHKGNPEGRSILRNSYRAYNFIRRIEEQEAILYERLNGLPVIKVPQRVIEAANAGVAEALMAMETYKNIARNLRIDEQMGVVLPSDTFDGTNGPSAVPQFSIELVAPGGARGGGSGAQSDTTIQRHQTNMLMSAMADFLSLGHGARGTQALAVSKTDMFFQAAEGYLNSQAGVFNRHALPRVWELNGMDDDLLPQYVPDLAQRIDLDILGNYVLHLAQAGMAIFPDRDVESMLKDTAGIPDVADEGADDILNDVDTEKPVPIVGPGAAALMPKPPAPVMMPGARPGGPPQPGSPADKFEKMIHGSMARRFKRMNTARGGLTKRQKAMLPTVG